MLLIVTVGDRLIALNVGSSLMLQFSHKLSPHETRTLVQTRMQGKAVYVDLTCLVLCVRLN